MSKYAVYILTNKRHTVLYTGVTSTPEIRVEQHRNKVVKGFTQKYNLDKVVYIEYFSEITDAITAEKKIKGWTRAKKIALIESINPEWRDLVAT